MTRSAESKRRWARWGKRLLWLLLGLCGVLVMVLSSLPKPVLVELGSVVNGPLEVTISEDGLARVRDRYLVGAPIAGSLRRLELRPGDRVEQGQVLARIVPLASPLLDARSRSAAEARIAAALAGRRQAHAQVERARAALEFAQKTTERQRLLAERGSISRAELERSELEVRTLRAELDSAEFGAKVADYELAQAQAARGRLVAGPAGQEQLDLPSPITGQVLRVLQQSEGVVSPGTALLELGDPRRLEVVVDVLTSDAVRIRPGAEVRLDRWGGKRLRGVVRQVEPSAFTRVSSLGVEEQRVNVLIDLRSPPEQWAALGDGYRVEAEIVVERVERTLKIPTSAVFRHGSEWAAFVVEAGVARLVRVELGRRGALEVEVRAGLVPGQAVVLHPGDRVKDGVRVAAR